MTEADLVDEDNQAFRQAGPHGGNLTNRLRMSRKEKKIHFSDFLSPTLVKSVLLLNSHLDTRGKIYIFFLLRLIKMELKRKFVLMMK